MNIVYLNGQYLPDDQALVSVLDRGFVFGDGVYEVIPAYGGQLFRLPQHLERLNTSLAAIRMQDPLGTKQWAELLTNLIRFNPSADDQSLYVQITRGPAKRDHAIPKATKPTLFAMCTPITPPDQATLTCGVSVVTLEDIRWKYCHIKAITLLPNVLLRADATEHGAGDAILLRDGLVSEGTASNVFIWRNDALLTPPKSSYLLPGITRDLVLEIAQQHGVSAYEHDIPEAALRDADEIWLTSSTKEILPVTQINGHPVGAGVPGERWRTMLAWYQDYKRGLRAAPASSERAVGNEFMTTNPAAPEITYPCEVPIKAMGLAHPNFDSVIVEIVRRHVPDLDEGLVRTRPSSNGKYVSVTVTITANSRAQLESIYLDLKACEQVVMTL